MKQKPLFQNSVATGNYYIVTSYEKLEKGVRARKKYDITEQIYNLAIQIIARNNRKECILCGDKESVVPLEFSNKDEKFDTFLCNDCIDVSGVRIGAVY